MATNANGYRLKKSERRGGPLNKTMKIALSILLGANAMIALIIFILNHQLP